MLALAVAAAALAPLPPSRAPAYCQSSDLFGLGETASARAVVNVLGRWKSYREWNEGVGALLIKAYAHRQHTNRPCIPPSSSSHLNVPAAAVTGALPELDRLDVSSPWTELVVDGPTGKLHRPQTPPRN